MRFPIEVELQTDGSVIDVMQRVSPITIQLLKALFVPLMCQVISNPMRPRRLTWRISYAYLPKLIRESAISSSTAKLPVGRKTINGENTQA